MEYRLIEGVEYRLIEGVEYMLIEGVEYRLIEGVEYRVDVLVGGEYLGCREVKKLRVTGDW